MRIVLIHRYFWPDTPPYAHILREIALRLGESGHQVTVLTCQPSYRPDVVERAPRLERLAANVLVRRWSVLPDRTSTVRKGLNLIWFAVRLLVARQRLARADVVMAASTPPIAIAKLSRWIAHSMGAKFIYHRQDIYPEVVLAPGILKPGLLARAARWLDARTDRAADRVVVLSSDMAATVVARGVEPRRIDVINNFDPWRLPNDERAARPVVRPPGPLRVVFAGNLGRFQNLESVIAAAADLDDDDRILFDFFGDGELRAKLDATVAEKGLRRIQVHGYRPPEEVAQFLRTTADVGIVSVAPGVIRAAYPSKTMSYLRQGCPVLAVVEAGAALARTLVESGAGYQADPRDPADIARCLRRLAAAPDQLRTASERSAALYATEFAQDVQISRWLDLFDQLAMARRPATLPVQPLGSASP